MMISRRSLIIGLGSTVTVALARDHGQYTDVDPKIREWFKSQKSPKTKQLCCDISDGTYAEEDIRDGVYWAQWRIQDKPTGWIRVDPEVVINDPNRNGAPVVWWRHESGKPIVYCYAPGGGV